MGFTWFFWQPSSVFVNSSNRVFVMNTEFVLCEVGTCSFMYSVNGRQCWKGLFFFFFLMVRQPLVGQGLLTLEASRSHSDTPHSVGLFWTSDRPDAETSAWQHTTLTTDRHPCPQAGFQPTVPPSERPQTHTLGGHRGLRVYLMSSFTN